MFELNNILNYTSANIQIIGIFIAIIGGLVATKILNTKIEKDTLLEKLSKIEKEIRFYKRKKINDEEEVYKINKEDYIDYIYEKVEDIRYIEGIKHLLSYITSTQKRNLSHMQPVEIKINKNYLKMDIHTKRNLE